MPVIEIGVKVGDTVEKEQSLVTLESDKATMDVPAAGVVKEIKVKVGDSVSEGTLIVLLEAAGAAAAAPQASAPAPAAAAAAPAPAAAPAMAAPAPAAAAPAPAAASGEYRASHASPSVRVRTRGVEVARVQGSGPKGRIEGRRHGLREGRDDRPARSTGRGSRAGRRRRAEPAAMAEGRLLEVRPVRSEAAVAHQEDLGANLHRNWVMIPHVTNNDEADITERHCACS